MNVELRLARPDDVIQYTAMMQATYTASYVNESIGLTPDQFSEQVFASDDTQRYIRSKLIQTSTHTTWVAVADARLIGAVTVEDKDDECEMSGFYVLSAYQRRGIGKQLWQKVLEVAGDRAITLDTYVHNVNTIPIYEHWGFREDTSRPHFYRHWPEWPEGLEAECLYMRREPNKNIG